MPFLKTAAARFTAGLLLTTTLIAPVLAATGTVVSGDTTLRVRAEANVESAILTNLDNGTQVDVLSSENGWYQIAFNGLTGYVASDYLSLNSEQPATDAVAASTEPCYGKVTTASLNIRSGAGTDFEKIGTLRLGKIVTILGECDGWYQLESGYVSSDYVTIVDAAEASRAGKGQEIVDFALQYVGYPYVYGGSSPKGFDCSGFTRYVYSQFGYSINRTASNQMDNGTSVSMSELEPGDLVFFKRSGSGSKRASHVGIYIGGNQFVHASTARVGVIVSGLDEAYYTSGFVGGRRLV